MRKNTELMNKDGSLLPPLPKHPIGEAKVWLTGMGLSLGLLMVFGLLGIILYNGLETFWPKTVYTWVIQDAQGKGETTLFATMVKDRSRRDYTQESALGESKHVKEYQLFTGNKQVYGQAFRYVDHNQVKSRTVDDSLLMIERMEGGMALVKPQFIAEADDKKVSFEVADFMPILDNTVKEADDIRGAMQDVERREIARLNTKLSDVRTELKYLRASYDFTEKDGVWTATLKDEPVSTSIKDPVEQWENYRSQESELVGAYDGLIERVNALKASEPEAVLHYVLGDGKEYTLPVKDIVSAYQPNRLSFLGKCRIFLRKFFSFIWDEPREANTEGGIFPAIFGTFVMTILMSVLVTPIGVIAAIYLREYAKQGMLVQVVRICVNNLAGVPSIVFGVFGLGFFVYFVGGNIDSLFFSKKLAVDNAPTFGTSGILWASLTLALMTLPVVIVATEEALAAVPRGLREAALACGASKWQMIQRIILPGALPGIMTGLILAMARGAGEVAPLMVTGVVKLAPALPIDGEGPFIHLERKFMHLGFHIYDVGFQSPDSDAAQPMVFATTLLLILLVIVMNLSAILIRNHLRKKYQTSAF